MRRTMAIWSVADTRMRAQPCSVDVWIGFPRRWFGFLFPLLSRKPQDPSCTERLDGPPVRSALANSTHTDRVGGNVPLCMQALVDDPASTLVHAGQRLYQTKRQIWRPVAMTSRGLVLSTMWLRAISGPVAEAALRTIMATHAGRPQDANGISLGRWCLRAPAITATIP